MATEIVAGDDQITRLLITGGAGSLAKFNDFESASEIVRNAQQALIESHKFGYQHLVAAATHNLVHSSRSAESNSWVKLSDYLKYCARLSRPRDLNLYDAAMNLIRENIAVTSDNQSAQSVIDHLRAVDLIPWYEQMRELVRVDPTMRRVPWLSRLLV